MENCKVLFICAGCRRQIRAGLDMEELTGDTKPEKDDCAFCGRRCYGGWYKISYRKKGASA